ncbi:MAG TPA: hypothetical protein VM843_00165 [Flavisolibacter sp.]|nr:hypothetical protein [Flavisolibacter sp.]
MRKYLPYILGAVVLIALSALLLSSADRKRKLNERITLKQQDKIPYGFYTARQLLPSLFPSARVYNDHRPPGYWDSLNLTAGKQALVLVGDLKADREELVKLTDFASR